MPRGLLLQQPPTADVGRRHQKGPGRLPLIREPSPKRCQPNISTETNPVAPRGGAPHCMHARPTDLLHEERCHGATIGCGYCVCAWLQNMSVTLSAALQAADAMADAQTVEEVCFAQRSRVKAGVFGHVAPKSPRDTAARPPPSAHKKEALSLESPPSGAATTSSSDAGQGIASTTSLTAKRGLARQCRNSVLRQLMCGGMYFAGRTLDVLLNSASPSCVLILLLGGWPSCVGLRCILSRNKRSAGLAWLPVHVQAKSQVDSTCLCGERRRQNKPRNTRKPTQRSAQQRTTARRSADQKKPNQMPS